MLDRRPERRVSFSLQPVQKIAALVVDCSAEFGLSCVTAPTSMPDEAGRLPPRPFGRPVTSYGPSMRVADLPWWRSRDVPVFSLMKRWGLGIYRGLRRKQIETYLNEFV